MLRKKILVWYNILAQSSHRHQQNHKSYQISAMASARAKGESQKIEQSNKRKPRPKPVCYYDSKSLVLITHLFESIGISIHLNINI